MVWCVLIPVLIDSLPLPKRLSLLHDPLICVLVQLVQVKTCKLLIRLAGQVLNSCRLILLRDSNRGVILS